MEYQPSVFSYAMCGTELAHGSMAAAATRWSRSRAVSLALTYLPTRLLRHVRYRPSRMAAQESERELRSRRKSLEVAIALRARYAGVASPLRSYAAARRCPALTLTMLLPRLAYCGWACLGRRGSVEVEVSSAILLRRR
eukprot:204298-Rhodomonas_salina.4